MEPASAEQAQFSKECTEIFLTTHPLLGAHLGFFSIEYSQFWFFFGPFQPLSGHPD
jgi:hypothetical protein